MYIYVHCLFLSDRYLNTYTYKLLSKYHYDHTRHRHPLIAPCVEIFLLYKHIRLYELMRKSL